MLFNAHHEPVDFTLPPASFGQPWSVVIDTTSELGRGRMTTAAGSTPRAEGRRMPVLTRP